MWERKRVRERVVKRGTGHAENVVRQKDER